MVRDLEKAMITNALRTVAKETREAVVNFVDNNGELDPGSEIQADQKVLDALVRAFDRGMARAETLAQEYKFSSPIVACIRVNKLTPAQPKKRVFRKRPATPPVVKE